MGQKAVLFYFVIKAIATSDITAIANKVISIST
jgi:hypothetical protein